MTLDDAHDTYTKMAGKMSIFMQIRSHITNFDDLEAIEVLVKLAFGLCFTFSGVGSNPGWGVVFFLEFKIGFLLIRMIILALKPP